MKRLVIGATGGTGRCVVENALRTGHEVTAFARTPQKITMQHQRLRVAQGDVLQSDAVLHAMPTFVQARPIIGRVWAMKLAACGGEM